MRRAVVTGGGTGIGLAVTRRLVADGADVVVVGRRRDVLERAAAEVDAAAGRSAVTVETADLREPDEVAALAGRVVEGGPVDALVLNAGGMLEREGDGLAETARLWTDEFRLNVLTTVLLGEALLPHLTRPGGRVVAMSSVAALRGAGSYGAAKAAINSWVTGLAGSVARDGITVNAVAPGFVPDTEFWDGRLDDEQRRARVARIPAGRPGTVEEVAAAVAYLTGPDAGWTTGQVLAVHGGAVLARL
ncbi:SDR family NAD(P)-dependent oxidoreductase [Cellulomonas chitinilytica]|uniref:SDR family NAD(P)-dependent oxidoreductase n=1 Tax=Cellulomonas chitinilytica TaxID=398759 RepID=UPI001941A7A7|nr:SDR family oxidoreductase [Cellulomonas chitinilytica]